MDIKLGDKLKDCDPRSNGRIKEVIAFNDDFVYLDGPAKSRVARRRIHNKPESKKGYYLMPRERF